VGRFVLWRCVHAFDCSGDVGQPSSMRGALRPQRNCYVARNERQLWWCRRSTDTRTRTQWSANSSIFCGFPCSFLIFGGAREGIRGRIAEDAGASAWADQFASDILSQAVVGGRNVGQILVAASLPVLAV